ncbi:hypothetical protein [Tenacibaculum sp. nBUS_03]|uniref:hypothetical protein n=1 Tax=Tenacibaculum sp. nBUS_03 TaxID=3395320 RepID=UPI003EB8E4A5
MNKNILLFTFFLCLLTKTYSQGRVYKDYHDNGKISSKGKLIGTNRHIGEWKYYYDNGQLRKIVNFNDKERFEGEYKSYHENGNLKKIGKYKNGEEIGEWKHFHKNKKLRVNRKYANGSRIGKWVFYFENGNIEKIESYVKGKRSGEWKHYYRNNVLMWIENYKNGKLNGRSEEYHDNGKLRVIKYHNESKPIGDWTYYHENESLNLVAYHKNGKPVGDWIYLDENGKVFRVEEHDEINEDSWSIDSFVSKNPFELNDYILNDSSRFYDLKRLSKHIYEQNKIPILYYAANWCAPCLKVKNMMKEKPKIKNKLSKKFAFIKILISDDKRENLNLFSTKLSLSRDIWSIPTYTKLNKHGETYNMISGANWITENPLRIQEFEEKIETNKIKYHFKPINNKK